MRMKARKAVLEQWQTSVMHQQESLRNAVRPSICSSLGPSESPTNGIRMSRWWHAVARWIHLWWLETRRQVLADEVRGLALLEEDIEFALRLRGRRSPR
jgi:hypothetical protein